MADKELLAEEAKYWDELYKFYLDYNLLDVRRRKRIPVPAWWASPKVGYLLYRREILTYLSKNLMKTHGEALEIGCGTGWLSLELARMGMNVIATDIVKKTLVLARRYSRKQDVSVEYSASDMAHLPFGRKSFDLIIACDSLHHIPNVHGVLQNIKGLLKDDGKFFAFDYVGESSTFARVAHPLRVLLGSIRNPRRYSFAKHLQGGSPHEAKGARTWLASVKMLFDVEKETHLMFLAHRIIGPLLPYLQEKSIWLTLLTLLLKSFDGVALRILPNLSEYVSIVAAPRKAAKTC